MPLPNHMRAYRPLRAGCYVFNPLSTEPGTLGLFATSNGTDRWIVSCYHVLCRPDFSPFNLGEPVFQPTSTEGVVATVERGDPSMDVAAARVAPTVTALLEVLSLPPVNPAVPPQIGMRVIKSGMATGVTEGEIVSIDASGRVEIAQVNGFPANYQISDVGDSGAAWCVRATMQPVAIHTGVKPLAAGVACGIDINIAMATLNLRLLR